MSYFNIGSLTIPAVWLAVLLSLFMTSLLYRFASGRKLEDWYWNSFFLYFLVWKLSYALFHFKMAIEMPLSIVYFNGSTKGHFLALVSLSVYLIYIAGKKHQTVFRDAFKVYPLFFIGFEVTKYALETNFPAAMASLALLIGYAVFLKKKNECFSIKAFTFLFLFELLIISFFQPILSLEILTFGWLAFILYILSNGDRKNLSFKLTS